MTDVLFKKKSKYNAVKSGDTDSKIEVFIGELLDVYKKGGFISDYKRLKKGDDSFEVAEGYYVNINGKKSKIRNIKYTPDFYMKLDKPFKFYLNNLPEGEYYIECKGGATFTDGYELRKKLFIQKFINKNTRFIELEIANNSIKTITIYEGV